MKIIISFKPIFFLFLSLFFLAFLFFPYKFFITKTTQAEEEIRLLKERLARVFLEKKDEQKVFDLSQIINDYNKDFFSREQIIQKSKNIKGIYLTKGVANSYNKDPLAKKIIDRVKKIIDETEINGLVIDVKDEYGFAFSEDLKKLIEELHQKNVWLIARIVACREAIIDEKNLELYLRDKNKNLWRDQKGYYWLDPASSQTQKYIIEIAEEAIDFGFDEIQFDYLRFPSDDQGAFYPFYDKKMEKEKVVRDFYLKIRDNLREYKKEIVLSVDLFGETAIKFFSPEIGQNLAYTIDVFDYISFMLYPSHFYFGFAVKRDERRNLPALYFPPKDKGKPDDFPSNHPYEIVLRSIFSAEDFISSSFEENLKSGLQPACLSQNGKLLFCPKPKIRPWLQDFDLKEDTQFGIFYDEEKLKIQIQAAEDAQSAGWLLWNPSNDYHSEVLKKVSRQ